MARTSNAPSYEKSKRRYVANIKGEKLSLLTGVDKTPENDKVAQAAYDRLKAVSAVQTTGDRSEIWVVLNDWLRWLVERPFRPVSQNTLDRHTRVVNSFIEVHGKVIAKDLRAHHLEEWLKQMQIPHPHPVHKQPIQWKEGSIKLALGTMKTAFKWAVARGYISSNPFLGPDSQSLESPSICYTEKRLAITQEEHEALLRLAVTRSHKDWAILLMLLWGTGARPSELIEAKAEEWDEGRKAFIIRCEDLANKGRFKLLRLKKDRIVYVPDELVMFIRLLIEKYQGKTLPDRCGKQTTPLFRKEKGKAKGEMMSIGSANAHITASAAKLEKDAGRQIIRPGVKLYSQRHGFTTRWIAAGKNIKILAELLGTSVLMIEKHYSHLFREHDVLRASLNSPS